MGQPADSDDTHSPESAPALGDDDRSRSRRARWWRWLTDRGAPAPSSSSSAAPASSDSLPAQQPLTVSEKETWHDPEGLLPTALASLAMRDLTLVDSLLAFVERLERQEEDPEQLEVLFQIDHLATRMRRNGENLLILAGHGVEGKHSTAVPLLDVVRAAMSEISEYTRVRAQELPENAAVSPEAADDISHLIAELLDNAIANSSGNIPVVVRGRLAEDRSLLLEVIDDGIGIPQDRLTQLNDWLATPPELNEEVIRHMGLYVVSRLAARQGASVQLQTRPFSGTTAYVRIPTELIQSAPNPLSVPVTPAELSLPAARRGPVPRPASPVSLGPTGLPRREPKRKRSTVTAPKPEHGESTQHQPSAGSDGELWELPRRRPAAETAGPVRDRRREGTPPQTGQPPGFAERIRADLDGFISGQTEAAQQVARGKGGDEGNGSTAGSERAMKK